MSNGITHGMANSLTPYPLPLLRSQACIHLT